MSKKLTWEDGQLVRRPVRTHEKAGALVKALLVLVPLLVISLALLAIVALVAWGAVLVVWALLVSIWATITSPEFLALGGAVLVLAAGCLILDQIRGESKEA